MRFNHIQAYLLLDLERARLCYVLKFPKLNTQKTEELRYGESAHDSLATSDCIPPLEQGKEQYVPKPSNPTRLHDLPCS